MITMAKQPNKTSAGANVQASAGQAGAYGTEFASETNVQKVKQQNAQAAGQAGAYGTEFAGETNAQEVRQQNAQAESRKGQNS